MELSGDDRCSGCQKKGSKVCVVPGDVAEYMEGGCAGKAPYPHACDCCRKAKAGCELPGWNKGKKSRKSKAHVEASEEESSEDEDVGDEIVLQQLAAGIEAVDGDLVKMDGALALVQTAVEELTDKVLELDDAHIVESNWVRDRLLEVKRAQRKQEDILLAILGSLPGGGARLGALEAKWKKEAEDAAERKRKREASEKESTEGVGGKDEAEASRKKKGKAREVSELGSGSMDLNR